MATLTCEHCNLDSWVELSEMTVYEMCETEPGFEAVREKYAPSFDESIRTPGSHFHATWLSAYCCHCNRRTVIACPLEHARACVRFGSKHEIAQYEPLADEPREITGAEMNAYLDALYSDDLEEVVARELG